MNFCSISYFKRFCSICFSLSFLVFPSIGRSQFVVSGSQILNGATPFIIKGANIEGYNSYFYRDCSNDGAALKTWGFNAVRIRCFIGNPHPEFGQQYNTSKPWLYAMIDKLRAQGLVVIVGAFDHTGGYFSANSNPTLQQLKDFHNDLATRYKADSGVWYNVTNEPGNNNAPHYDSVDPQWQPMHKEVISSIRNTGNNHIIMVDGHLWGQDSAGWDTANVMELKSAILSQGASVLAHDPRKNVVFSVHFYDQWENGGIARIRDYFDRVKAKGLALVVGEYGSQTNKNAVGAYVAPGRYAALTTNVLTAVQERGVGRMVWSWDAGDAWDLVDYTSPSNWTYNGGGWEINNVSGPKPTNLSWMGDKVWDDNRIPDPVAGGINLLQNPGFESGQISPWTSWISNLPLAAVTGFANQGSHSLRVSPSSGGQANITGFVSNRSYTFSAHARIATADGSTQVVTVKGSNFQYDLTFNTTTYTRKSVTFTVPTNSTWMQVTVWKNSGAIGYVDDISLQ